MKTKTIKTTIISVLTILIILIGITIFSDNPPNNSKEIKEPEITEEEIINEPEIVEEENKPEIIEEGIIEETIQPSSNLFSIVKVVDGDTIKVNIDGTTETIRLIGINTPETVDPRKPVECFGIEASNRAKELLTGKKVRLESDSTQGDRGIYGRLLRYVWLEDGTFFNKQMISDGYAYEYTYNTPYKYQAEFKQSEKEARENKRGLWADNACVQEEQEEEQQEPEPTDTPSGHIFYLSTYHTAKYYYCDTDNAWESLSEKYLKSYPSEIELLTENPEMILHEPCK